MIGEKVFLDASFWIAYRDHRQPTQPDAERILHGLFRQRTIFVTTLLVICEIQAYFSRHQRMRQMVLTDLWNNPVCQIERVSGVDEQAAIALLKKVEDKSYSLCDALSFVVMKRMAISKAVSFDDHFRQFGEFEVLR